MKISEKYLLDTNICIYYLKGSFELDKKLSSVDSESIFISEITLAELKFGAANSQDPKKNDEVIENFLTGVQIIPIFDALNIYAKEKTRPRKAGKPVDDFDLLIGATAIANDMVLVTNNTKHFERLRRIKLANWTDS